MSICQERTVIITGAAGGLGRAYALELAAQGANIVVNDIDVEASRDVVARIVHAGGKAVHNQFDITNYAEAKNIVAQALSEYGQLHAVVNNAGINRDRMFVSTTEEEWDAVIAVHLKGHFCVSSHAANYWREQHKAGKPVDARIINTSSGAGLLGSVGQANYSAAKAGIASLSLVQAHELRRYGITVNTIVPAARTGMTEAVFADMMKKPKDGSFDVYDPGNIAPLIAWLVSTQSKHVSAHAFEVQGGKLSIAQGWKSTQGVDKGARWDVSEIGSVVDTLIANAVPAQPVYGS